jgi:hypothetical protein
MTQEKFSTIEECCEFANQFIWLTNKEKLEQKDEVVAIHIALTKHIDEIVNRVCARHGLKCQWLLNYRLRCSLGRGGCGEITLSPKLLFLGANSFRGVILHELAHLTHLHHRRSFWETHIAYMQEENLLPQGEITGGFVLRPALWPSKKMEKCYQLDLNGKPIVLLRCANPHNAFGYSTYFQNHNSLIPAPHGGYMDGYRSRAVKAMKEIIMNTPNRKELAIKVRL